jgi:cytochrome c-type biogenesis protein CcmH
MDPSLGFVLIAGALVATALAFVLPALLQPRPSPGASRAQLNADIYRQQLSDIARDRAHGLVGPVEAERVGDELRRRLLDDVEPEPVAGPRNGRRAAAAVALVLPVGAALLYLIFGSPRALDRPLPPGAAAREASAGVDELDAHLRDHPTDARAWVLLARGRMERNEFGAAAEAFGRAMAASQKVARDPSVLCEYADALAMEQGSLQGRPLELVGQALALDGRHPQALEMAGSAAFERGRYGEAVAHWERLLEQIPFGSERHRELATAIERARRSATPS